MKSSMNLLKQGKLMLPQVVLLATLFSCSKQDLQETSVQNETNNVQVQESLAATASSATMYFEETFEGSDPFYPAYDLKERFAGSHSFQVVTNPAFAGAKAGRFELRASDVEVSGGTRAEVRFPLPETSDLNRWYSWSAYFPAADYKYDSEDEVLNQWHQGSGYSPSISLRVKEDRLWLYVKPTTETTQKIDLGAVPKDKWTSFVFHINHADDSNGLIELWINGAKVLNRTGANTYDLGTFEAPRWNVGIYKSAWNGSQTTETSKRVIIYDNIRLGGKNETYATMSAGGSTSTTTEPAPAPAPDPAGSTTPTTGTTTPTTGSSFFLVNANTEKDLFAVPNGAVINLAKLGTVKLNMRSNIATSGSVQFVLSGAMSKTFTDGAAPYALHGDNGTGNFYYGNWGPPALGTYTLKATASNGTTSSITFTFVNNSTAPAISTGTTTTAPSTSTTTSPSTSTSTTPSTSTSAISFSLIDASTEKAMMTITNGAVISLSKLASTKLNITANSTSSLGSVQFVLSGAMSKTYTDGRAPFALHGDSGTGNFYYGNWNPPALGTYTLKATASNGMTSTISFTFVQ